MIPVNEIPSISELEAERVAVAAVLASASFANSPRLIALLDHLCTRYFLGEANLIKEYSVATDVFGRPTNFDQSTDAIVRVEMHRLRKKLREYYADEGLAQPIEIVIQPGRYVPEFRRREREPSGKVETTTFAEPQLPMEALTVEVRGPRTHKEVNWTAYLVWALAAIVLIGGSGVALQVFHRESARAATPPPLTAASADEVRILCGVTQSGLRDRSGKTWDPDMYYTGGVAVEVPTRPIFRTRQPFLFHSMRSGEFSYKIPLKPGTYEMRLYFVDLSYSPGPAMDGGEGLRIFDVVMNGTPILRRFDIIADAGPDTADVKVFKDVRPASDGYLYLRFAKSTDTPLLNAIEIVPGVPHKLRSIRMSMQDGAYTGLNGVTWAPDEFFMGGRSNGVNGRVSDALDSEIYARERYGNFSYAIPVADGRYAVTLHFAESYFGPNAPGGGGKGSRIFDVSCNGTKLLNELDIFSEVGSHHVLIKNFHGLPSSAQGKLLLSFVPSINYATLSAIEVSDESN